MRMPWDKPLIEAKQEEPAIRFVGDFQRLKPEPGDVFVLSCDAEMSRETVEILKAQISPLLGGAKVIVLAKGMKLGCVAMPGTVVNNFVNTGPTPETAHQIAAAAGRGILRGLAR